MMPTEVPHPGNGVTQQLYIYIYGLGACSGPPRFGESGKMLLSYSLSGRSIWGARKTHRVIYIINLKDQ